VEVLSGPKCYNGTVRKCVIYCYVSVAIWGEAPTGVGYPVSLGKFGVS